MPFKTRKQKQAASDRRMTFVKKALVTYYKNAGNQVEQKNDKNQVFTEIKANILEKDYPFVKRDLLKIGIICIIIFGFQIIFRVFYYKLPLPF